MFNGIVAAIGVVQHRNVLSSSIIFKISANRSFLADLQIGESIAVNGVCLTVTEFSLDFFVVTVVPETLRVTNLTHLIQGAEVNLERALKLNDRLSGHWVQGHVDAAGKITHIEPNGEALLYTIHIPTTLTPYIVDKGFVTIDGMSITVITANKDFFTVTIIPHTQKVTISKHYKIGTEVNIEVDILSKYIRQQLGVNPTCNLLSNALNLP